MNPSYEIKTPLEQDGASLILLAKKIDQFSINDIECIQDRWKESLHSETDPDRYHFIVAKKFHQIIGFACYGHRPLTKGTYDFYWLGVDPAFQKQGVGKALMAQVENAIKEKKGYLLIIETSSIEEFSIPRSIYESFGYQLIAQIPDFYEPGDGLVIYTKKISS